MILTWIDADAVEWEISEANGIDLSVIEGLDAPPVELSASSLPVDGSSLTHRRWGPRVVTLGTDIAHPSRARTVIGDMARRFRGPGSLRYSDDEVTRELHEVYYDGGLEGVDLPVPWFRRAIVSLLALDPMWYGDTVTASFGPPEGDQAYDTALPYDEENTYDGAASGLAGTTATYDAALPYDEAEPYDGGALFAPVLASYEGAWVTFTFHGPATQARVLHLRTGEVVELKDGQSLGAAQDLVVTTDPRSRDITVAGQPAWDRVTPESTAAMMLVPGDQLALIMSGTSADSYLLVAYDERWLTL